MDFAKICRTCLGSDNLNPIFINGVDHSSYFNAVYQTTGIKVKMSDGLPQNMCTQCIVQLNNALKFRKQSQNAEKQLLTLKNNLNVMAEWSEQEIKEEYCEETEIEVEDVQIKMEITEALSDDEKSLSHDEKLLLDDEKPLTSNENPLMDHGVDKNIQNKTYDCRNEGKTEIIVSNPNKPNRVTCSLCQMELSVRSVAGHMARRHPGADETKVKCELCEVYVTRSRLKRHIVTMHGNQGFKCGYCKTDFQSKEVLLDHVSACTAKKKKRKAPESSRQLSECDICHKTMQKASLRLHKAVKHAGLRPVCEHCGERFGNKYRLTEHYRAKHGYEKFKCSYCDFESAAIMAMRNHERRHRGEKPFVCKSCGAKFHAAYLLAQHKQSHRTEKLIKPGAGEQDSRGLSVVHVSEAAGTAINIMCFWLAPYYMGPKNLLVELCIYISTPLPNSSGNTSVMCEQCPARFKANNSLNMHKLTCHSNSLYKCTMCVRAYSCRHYAVKHMRQVHQYTGPVPRLQRVPAKPEDDDDV